MKWFSKDTNKNDCNEPVNMSPLESVTHLCASIQVADGQSDNEERMVWKEAITELFPNLNDQRAENFMNQALVLLSKKNQNQINDYTLEVLKRVKTLLDKDQISALAVRLGKLIEADGIAMTSEISIMRMIENELGVKINIEE